MRILLTLRSVIFFSMITLLNPIISFSQDSKRNLNLNSLDEISRHIEQSLPYGTYLLNEASNLDLETFQNSLNSNPDISFKLYFEKKSIGDTSYKFMKFQQYYKNIKVDRHGYTLKVKDGNIVSAISLNVNLNMEVDLNDLLSKQDLNELANCSDCRSEIIISHQYSDDYSTVLFVDKMGPVEIYDAHKGLQLVETSSISYLNGNTTNYGTGQVMCDFQTIAETSAMPNGTHMMMTGQTTTNSKIVVYNHPAASPASGWPTTTIPITTGSSWANNPLAAVNVDQTVRDMNFAVCESVSRFEDLYSTEFEKVHVAINSTNITQAQQLGDLAETFLTLGSGGSSVLDIVGHELAHSYQKSVHPMYAINPSSDALGLMEGLSDIYGTIVEADFEGQIDWVIGDKSGLNIRDLSQEVTYDFTDPPHTQGHSVGHWFHLCHEGNSNPSILPIDLETLKTIIDNAFVFNHGDLSIPKFAQLTLLTAQSHFTVCDDDEKKFLKSIKDAWQKINVGQANYVIEINDPSDWSTVLEEKKIISFPITFPSVNRLTSFTIKVNADLNIDIPFIFRGCNFEIADNVTIDVNADVTLENFCENEFDSVLEAEGNEWYGMFVRDENTLTVEGTLFEDAKYAVVCLENSTIEVTDSHFKDCNTGIWLTGESISNSVITRNLFEDCIGTSGISLTGSPEIESIELIDNEFDNCDIGIRGFRTEVEIKKSRFIDCHTAVTLNNCDNSFITQNFFDIRNYGIYVYSTDNLTVGFNEMHSQNYGYYAVGFDLRNCTEFLCGFNQVHTYSGFQLNNVQGLITINDIDSHDTGVLCRDSDLLELINNKITSNLVGTWFTNCFAPLISNNEINAEAFGVLFNGGTDWGTVNDNHITSNLFSLSLFNSSFNVISCNVTSGEIGLTIEANSDIQWILENQFNNDLCLEVHSETQPQPYHGNEFNGNQAAEHFLSQNVIEENQFTVETPTSPYTPVNHQQGSDWFDFNANNGTSVSCDNLVGPDWFGGGGGNSAWTCKYLTRLNSSATQNSNRHFVNLYHILKYFVLHVDEPHWPDCIADEINSLSECGMMELIEVEKIILDRNSANLDQSDSRAYAQLLKFLDLEQSEISLDQMDQDNYLPLFEAFVSERRESQDHKADEDADWINPTIRELEAIKCNELVTTNFKQILKFRLREMKNDVFTPSDHLELQNIAQLCPDEYGDPVDWSRSYLYGTEYDNFELGQSCHENVRNREDEGKFVTSEFQIYPNPNSGTFILEFDNPLSGEVIISNQMGVVVKTFIAQNLESKSIDISSLNNGLYYLSFDNQNGSNIVKKLIKID